MKVLLQDAVKVQNFTDDALILAQAVKIICWDLFFLIYVGFLSEVLSVGTDKRMSSCSHEEADTRMMVHLFDALESGARVIQICTVDSDVVVIIIGIFHSIQEKFRDVDLWIGFGFKHSAFKHLHINTIDNNISDDRARGLRFFHAITGSDMTSAFVNKGKLTAWRAWLDTPEAADAFARIAACPFIVPSSDSPKFQAIEKFVVAMYVKANERGDVNGVNESRMHLFCSGNFRNLNRFPPTQDALYQHVKRVVLQASIWVTCDDPRRPDVAKRLWLDKGWRFVATPLDNKANCIQGLP